MLAPRAPLCSAPRRSQQAEPLGSAMSRSYSLPSRCGTRRLKPHLATARSLPSGNHMAHHPPGQQCHLGPHHLGLGKNIATTNLWPQPTGEEPKTRVPHPAKTHWHTRHPHHRRLTEQRTPTPPPGSKATLRGNPPTPTRKGRQANGEHRPLRPPARKHGLAPAQG